MQSTKSIHSFMYLSNKIIIIEAHNHQNTLNNSTVKAGKVNIHYIYVIINS